MSNSDRARLGALYPLMIAFGIILGAASHSVGWVLVVLGVFVQLLLAIWFLVRDDSDVTEER